ncbi:MAG: formate dehydrogenase subunit gamma [Thiotrichales bacterium]
MRRDPRDLVRYTAGERAIHWVVGISFILLGLSGLALFHPAFWPLTMLFGGGTWTRILHPFVGIVLTAAFIAMFFRFARLNTMRAVDWQWLRRVREMFAGSDHTMPEQGKYNGGQKLMFWLLAVCVVILLVSGLVMWRSYFSFPVDAIRLASLLHALTAVVMICLIFVHVYAAIWVKGTVRAMWYGTVTRAWAKQHHRAWFKDVTRSNG